MVQVTMTSMKSIQLPSISTDVLVAGAIFANAVNAAPPGDIPFGAYDPPGDFSDDAVLEIEHVFLPWEDLYLPSLFEADEYAVNRNRAMLLTIEPWTWNRSERKSPQILFDSVRSGEYDHYMRDICEVFNEMQSPITVRFAQEMDDLTTQFIWAGWEPENYIMMFRRMMDICRAEAPRINIMWSPLGYSNMAEFYPGDDYVDLIGVSVFGLQKWEEDILGKSQSFEDIFGPRYERAAQFNKPIAIPELGYSGNAEYIDDWNNSVRQLGARFPNLVGVVYFNQKEVYPWPDNYGLPDWRVTEHTLTN